MVPVSQPIALDGSTQTDNVSSHSRNDGAAQLLRALKDNVGKYQVEVVAEIKRTHRFRGGDVKEKLMGCAHDDF
jgi:hypothetical protein